MHKEAHLCILITDRVLGQTRGAIGGMKQHRLLLWLCVVLTLNVGYLVNRALVAPQASKTLRCTPCAAAQCPSCEAEARLPARCCGPGCRTRQPVSEGHYDERYFQWQTSQGLRKATGLNWTTHLELAPGAAVADLGAGGGHILATLGTAAKVVAVEINPSARASMRRMYPHIERYEFPEDVPDNSLDVVYSTSAIEHFECPLTELREMVRKLRVGGRLIVGIKNEGRQYAGAARESDIHQHLWTWNRQLLYNTLRKAGVHVTRIDPPTAVLHRQLQKTPPGQKFIPYYWARGVKML